MMPKNNSDLTGDLPFSNSYGARIAHKVCAGIWCGNKPMAYRNTDKGVAANKWFKAVCIFDPRHVAGLSRNSRLCTLYKMT